ncbi:MAG: PIN domain-containing protein [Deltaproteobacteria bacterium]|nr:PIN domain-containing protein [Deltaproteobacteria bacterium]
MTQSLFIDTGAFYARYVARDAHHAGAVKTWREIATRGVACLTTNFVVAELITLLSYRINAKGGLQVAREIYGSHRLDVFSVTREIEISALEWLERFADQAFSMTDAVSFAVMTARKLETAFTFDHHFAIAGFRAYTTA